MDFRSIGPDAMAISAAKSRSLYPCLPRIPVQLPRARCIVSLGNFGYNLLFRFDREVPIHAAFAEWVSALESRAQEQMASIDPGLGWTTSLKGFGDSLTLYLTIDSASVVFDTDNSLLEASPTTLTAADAIVEIGGVWTSPTNAGLRWKLVQIKRQMSPPIAGAPVPAFLDDEMDGVRVDAPQAKRMRTFEPFMFVENDD